MSKQTAAASTIKPSELQPTPMLAMELGESGWLLGFAHGFGQTPLRRKIDSRDRKALLTQIAWAKQRLGLAPGARVVSCYEAGRDGFWLLRFRRRMESRTSSSTPADLPEGGATRRATPKGPMPIQVLADA